ncbi:MAG: alpha/beta fold hydrolase [Chitinophagales bacterium]
MKEPNIFKSEAGRKSILAAYDQIMRQWPLPYESKIIPTRHGETHIVACGSEKSPSLILLHGSGSNATMWIGDVSIFASSYRVYAIDIPGEPGKSEPVRRELEGPAYAEWMQDIFSGLGIQKAYMLGMSLGGWMALRFATVHPDMIEKLVLLCPAGVTQLRLSFVFRILPLMLMGKTDRVIQIINGNVDMPEEAMAYVKLINANFNPRTAIPVFADEEMKRLTMPVLAITGARDAFFPSAKTVARLSKLVPNVTTILLPEAGHLLINQTERVMSFLNL